MQNIVAAAMVVLSYTANTRDAEIGGLQIVLVPHALHSEY